MKNKNLEDVIAEVQRDLKDLKGSVELDFGIALNKDGKIVVEHYSQNRLKFKFDSKGK